MRLSSEWLAAWRDAAPEAARALEAGDEAVDEAAALDEALSVAVAVADARWPGLALPPEVVVRHYARAAAAGGEGAIAALERLHTADLTLACGCLHQRTAALAFFETAHLVPLASAFAGAVTVAAAEVDEIRQRLRIKLLVGDPTRGQPPLVGTYSGRGPLSAWVRVAAVREALTLARDAGIGARAGQRAAVEGALVGGAGVSPELQLMKGRYKRDFADAFAGALRGIAHRERALLRLHAVEGLSLEKIGAIYKVDRSTVSRWLADARNTLLDDTERGLRDRLGLQPAEVESIARLLTSQIDLDLPELLRTTER